MHSFYYSLNLNYIIMKPIFYLKIVGSIILYIACFGFICPWLISAKDDILPLVGVGIIIVVIYLLIVQIINLFKFFKNYEKKS